MFVSFLLVCLLSFVAFSVSSPSPRGSSSLCGSSAELSGARWWDGGHELPATRTTQRSGTGRRRNQKAVRGSGRGQADCTCTARSWTHRDKGAGYKRGSAGTRTRTRTRGLEGKEEERRRRGQRQRDAGGEETTGTSRHALPLSGGQQYSVPFGFCWSARLPTGQPLTPARVK